MTLGCSRVEAGWEEFARAANANYTSAAGLGEAPPVVRVASWDWVRAETERRMVASTASALLISLGIAATCILAFTRRVRTTLAASLAILAVNASLIALMVGGLGWSLGAVEAVSVTVFVGEQPTGARLL